MIGDAGVVLLGTAVILLVAAALQWVAERLDARDVRQARARAREHTRAVRAADVAFESELARLLAQPYDHERQGP